MICTRCGSEIEEGAGFCRICGNPVEKDPYADVQGVYDAVGTVSYQRMEAPKKKIKKWVIPVVALVVVLCVLAAIFVPKLVASSTRHKSPENVVEAFIKSIEKEKSNDMIKCYHPDVRSMMEVEKGALEDGIVLLQSFELKVGDKLYYDAEELAELNDEYGAKFTAACEVDIVISFMGMSEAEPMLTVEDNGKWYIYPAE